MTTRTIKGNPSLPPYPGRPKVHAKWRGLWHKAIWHHVPQAMRLPGRTLDWVVRACDGHDGPPDRRQSVTYPRLAIRETPPPKTAKRCPRCYR